MIEPVALTVCVPVEPDSAAAERCAPIVAWSSETVVAGVALGRGSRRRTGRWLNAIVELTTLELVAARDRRRR